MSSKIRVLSDDTINKIAAGEVIENPASVVKELSENSIDAGATEITIEIREGGRSLIRITDNGSGMTSDDALLCLERHATSKLKAVDEIEELVTMGFRGEAIPSIASISKFTLLTRSRESHDSESPGTMVIVDGGKIVKCCPVECAKGTTIEVKSLFFNVPVRRKFQKSPAYDAAEISRIVTLLALANPEVKFQLISNQETIISAPVFLKDHFHELLGGRIQQILGKDFSQGLCSLNCAKEEYSLQGFLGLPAAAKHNRTGQYLFINRRAVASPLISYAIRDGYGTMLGTGRHPIYVLHVTMPGNLLDVNVHPQKREVRLRQEHNLKQLIISAVTDALQMGGINTPLSQSSAEASQKKNFEEEKYYQFQSNSYLSSAFGPPGFIHDQEISESSFASFSPTSPAYAWPPQTISLAKVVKESPDSIYAVDKMAEPELFPHPKALHVISPEGTDKTEASKNAVRIKVLATMPRFIVAQAIHHDRPARLCLIDQHAAHARIMYDKFQSRGAVSLELQALLIPYIFDLAPAEAAFLIEQIPLLQKFGLQVKEFGHRSFMVDALPLILGNVDVHLLMEEVIRNLRHLDLNMIFDQEIEKKIVLAATRAAISGEKTLDLYEAQSLADQLMESKMPDHCPSGKPIMLMLSSKQIAAMFN